MPNQIQKIIVTSDVSETKDFTVLISALNQDGTMEVLQEINHNSLPETIWEFNLNQYLIALLSQEIQELEEMKKDTDKYFKVDNKRTGEKRYTGKGQCRSCMQFRDIEEASYNKCLTDLITKKKQIIKELEDK